MAKRDVVRFLVRLFGDPVHHGKYRKRPDAVMKAAGLSARERELLASGDERAIRAYLGDETVKTNVIRSGLTNVIRTAVTNVIKTAIRKPSKPKKKS